MLCFCVTGASSAVFVVSGMKVNCGIQNNPVSINQRTEVIHPMSMALRRTKLLENILFCNGKWQCDELSESI